MKLCKLILASSTFVVLGASSVAAASLDEEVKQHKDVPLADNTHQFSANMAMTSDYVWRGFSQSNNHPAIQGGFDYAHSSGFYLGTWGSNVESDPNTPYNYDGANTEIDLYAGWSGEFSGVSVDVGALHYEYSGTNTKENNTNEYHLGLGYDFGMASVGATANYSDDYFGAGENVYWDFGLEVPVGQVTLAAHYGITDYDNDNKGDDYEDLSIGASIEFGGFGFDLTYTDTSGVSGGCKATTCEGTTIFTVSKEF